MAFICSAGSCSQLYSSMLGILTASAPRAPMWERTGGRAPVLALQQGGVPAAIQRRSGQVDQRELAPAQLLGDQVLDGRRHPGPVGRRRPGRGLVGKNSDPVIGYPQLG